MSRLKVTAFAMALDIIEFTFRTLLLSWQVFDAEKHAVSPNGTLMANNQRQLALERIPLATDGPAAAIWQLPLH